MQLSGLDITLHRINAIENQFQSLMSYAQNLMLISKKILDSSVEKSKIQLQHQEVRLMN